MARRACRSSSRHTRSAPCRPKRAIVCSRSPASALRPFAPIPPSPALNWPQYRSGPRLLSRFRARIARSTSTQRLGRAARRDRHSARRAARRSSSARGPTASTSSRSGGARLIDYKSGAPPGPSEVKVGFAPQLTLEAAMLRRGGFQGAAAARSRAEALYLKLGGAEGRRGEARRRQKARYSRARREAFRRAQDPARPIRLPGDALPLAPVPQIRQPLLRLRPSRARQGMGDGGRRRRSGGCAVSRRLRDP